MLFCKGKEVYKNNKFKDCMMWEKSHELRIKTPVNMIIFDCIFHLDIRISLAEKLINLNGKR